VKVLEAENARLVTLEAQLTERVKNIAEQLKTLKGDSEPRKDRRQEANVLIEIQSLPRTETARCQGAGYCRQRAYQDPPGDSPDHPRSGSGLNDEIFSYGTSPKDWHLWLSDATDYFVGEIWDMIVRPMEVMPPYMYLDSNRRAVEFDIVVAGYID
jgi:hypothetical protein